MIETVKSICVALAISLLTVACQAEPSIQPIEVPMKQESTPDVQIETKSKLINPETWPLQQAVIARDAEMEQRINDLMARMTLEEKVGQLMQPDINDVTPEQVRQYKLGSILNGGGSAPDKNLRNTPDSWLALADEFWEASTDTSDGGVGIPVIWGTDAVHGHSNIVGATLFPHNIGLGAANDPDLIYEIGRITALEILTTGLDWTFAPTIAVVRNDRWGRTYEGYSEDPRIVVAYAPRIVEGLQGRLGTDEFLDGDHIIANAKHFVGDGGTINGKDQGDNQSTEAELRDIHAAAYPPAIAAGVQTVMASYSSFHGEKMHGMKSMLTDVLVGRMGFDGFVVGDWNGHGQIKGCNNKSCPEALNAGLDMFMVPTDWKALYLNTIEQVQSGIISRQRLDQAVARILRVKMRAGILDAPRPSERKNAGNWELLAAPAHRAIAREAVRKSLVLLKNENKLLPLSANANVLVAGEAANNIGKQSGGWSLSWQGTGNTNEDFPNATSIFTGVREALEANGGSAVFSENGDWISGDRTSGPDVAIVVFGEDPYAEGVGDRANVDYAPDDGLELLRKFKAAGIPTVSIFISGRPLWVNPELNVSDAFVAAWLPGSEGGGIADVLIADAEDKPRFDFTGRLSYSWPATAGQAEVNIGDDDYHPLFAYGYGLSYVHSGSVAPLSEDPGLSVMDQDNSVELIARGKTTGTWRLNLRDADGGTNIMDIRGTSPTGQLEVVPADNKIQEDTFIASWNGSASLVIEGATVNFQQQVKADQVLEITYRVISADVSKASLAMGQGVLDMTEQFMAKSATGWQTSRIRLSCFIEKGAQMDSITEPLIIAAEGSLKLQITSARLTTFSGMAACKL
jgi:beta-glucosidase